MTDCSCCGSAFTDTDLVRLHCRSDVAVCNGCVDWLVHQRAGLLRAVPVLFTEDVPASTKFWQAAGFETEPYSDDFVIAHRDSIELHLTGPEPSGRDRGEAYLHVGDVDGVHREWTDAGLPVTELRDEPWGMREFNVVDPGGNRLRVGRGI